MFEITTVLGIKNITIVFLTLLHLFVDEYPEAFENFSESLKVSFVLQLNRSNFIHHIYNYSLSVLTVIVLPSIEASSGTSGLS